ncbi:MAG TPA: FAD-linked oxidase C-terminal domain-containing protein [Rhodanobacteraceae bacterium]|nr:FAD-linked oxidase C-terminal domain-containing protein [Rhodanobacteraceae bacterium]
MALPAAFRTALEALFEGALAADTATLARCGGDSSALHAAPALVVFPRHHEQVQALVPLCRQHRVALTARGAGTGTTGACVPLAGGVVVSFERMNRILAIDAGNRVAVVEPGVLNGELQTALAAHGFFWPPDPSSAALCSIGGNLACNAGGPRTVKYGNSRDNTLALRGVAGHGGAFRCGIAASKLATGYDLTRLLVGSEGTLALITEATLKLSPLPSTLRSLRASYANVEAAALAVTRIMAQAATPCALEFLDGESLRLARAHAGAVVPDAGALLMIELDGDEAAIDAASLAVADAAEVDGLITLDVAASETQRQALWAARKALSPALRTISSHKINEDVVVPVAQLPALVAATRQLAAEYALPVVCFGHAGNGNLHVNLLPRDAAERARAPTCLAALFTQVIALGGTLSGEHGIGLAKRDFMPQALDAVTLDLMRGIKRTFDPDGILNPGKVLP